MDVNEGKSAPRREPVPAGGMTAGQRHYEAVSSIIGGYGRELPEWEELREADQRKLEAEAPAGEATSTVTVATMHGTRETWDASLCASIDGALVIGDSYADGSLIPLAAWAPGEWRNGGRDDRRLGPTSADHKARADTAEQVIRDIRDAAGDGAESFYVRLDSVLAVLARHDKATSGTD